MLRIYITVFMLTSFSGLNTSFAASHDRIADFKSCLNHFEDDIHHTLNEVTEDYRHALAGNDQAQRKLDQQSVFLTWIQNAYDQFAQDPKDWHHPEKQMTVIGKLRAYQFRLMVRRTRINELETVLKLHEQIRAQLAELERGSNRLSRIKVDDWKELFSRMRSMEQEYASSMNYEAQQRIYDRGLENEIDWMQASHEFEERMAGDLNCSPKIAQFRPNMPMVGAVTDIKKNQF